MADHVGAYYRNIHQHDSILCSLLYRQDTLQERRFLGIIRVPRVSKPFRGRAEPVPDGAADRATESFLSHLDGFMGGEEGGTGGC